MLESSKRKVPENFLKGSLRVEKGESSSCCINSEKRANEFPAKNRKEDLRIGFSSICDEDMMINSPSESSLRLCDKTNRSPSLMNKNENVTNVSLSTNNSNLRPSPKIKMRQGHEENKASEEIDVKSMDSANKKIRKHLHFLEYKKLFTKRAKGGNPGDKCRKEKSPLQRPFVNKGANSSEIKVSGDVGSTKDCMQDDRNLCVETSEPLEKNKLNNTNFLNTDAINQEPKSKFNGSKCHRMVPHLESNCISEQSGEEICEDDLSAMYMESPHILEKFGVGDGGICNSEILANLDEQTSKNIYIVSKASTNIETEYNICLVCKQPGQLICCWGKGCKRCYHLSCFNPLLRDVLPGASLCNFCVKKKLDLGVHSVLDEIESIWDVDEVPGLLNEKRYFVKYKGLAHVHNRWISETELLHHAPSRLAKFEKNSQKEINKWRKEWSEPERLLQKRLVAPLDVADEDTSVSVSEPLNYCIEWLVKWKGLNYDHATWELENSLLLFSSETPNLIKDYECRCTQVINSYDPIRADKALQIRKDPLCKLSSLGAECPVELDNDHLSYVNCLREFWHKSLNGVLVNGQERISNSVLFVLSLQSHACRPSLIITTSGSFQLWQADFVRLAPSMNVIIYQGDKDVRKLIQNLEFYDKSGRLMLQVLLADSKAVIEDLDDISCIGWESIIVDGCQNSKMTRYLEQLNTLATDFKLLLFSRKPKDSLSEYRILVSFLETGGTMDNGDTPCALTKLKEKFSRHIIFECNTDSSKFEEYWVPVPHSNVQLEQYCSTLFFNAFVLRSNLRYDVVEALHDILISLRKCCDHPYLVNGELRGLLSNGLQCAGFHNSEVRASGKLFFLGKLLQKIKDSGLRVVILFQSLGGYEKVSLGDILDDLLKDRFGADAYERIVAGMVTAKQKGAVEKFNDKEIGRFIFLIEKRACLPSVKLRSVDTIIILNSDWNPLNDLKSLQKIIVESQQNTITVFRFYTSYTVEEKILMLAKQGTILESSVESINRDTAHMLLAWGTSYLFGKLDRFHSSAKPTCISEPSFDKFCLNDLILEISALFSGKTKTSEAISFAAGMKAQMIRGKYSRNIFLMSEMEGISLPDKDLPIFWSGLFEGRRPKWMYISQHSQRIRRRTLNSNDFTNEAKEGDEVRRKRQKIKNISSTELSKEKGDAPEGINKSCMLESESEKQKIEDQGNLLMLLRPELLELCDILGLPESVKGMAQEFLEYILNNHYVSTNLVTVLQALKISLCWRAASMSRISLDHSGSLSLARKYLKFECTEREAYSVYLKLQILKEKFPSQSVTSENLSGRNILDDQSPPSETLDNGKETLDGSAMQTEATGNLTLGVDEFSIGYQKFEQLISQHGSYPIGETSRKFQSKIEPLNDISCKNQIDVIEEAFLRRSEELAKICQTEVWILKRQMHRDSLKMEETFSLDLELIQSLHIDETVRKAKVIVLTGEFSNKFCRFNLHRQQQKKKLMSMQLDRQNKEQNLKNGWLEKARAGMMVESLDILPSLEGRFKMVNFLEASEFTVNCNNPGTKILNYSCPYETNTWSSKFLNEREENLRMRDDSLASATSVIGDNFEQTVQVRLTVEPKAPSGLSGVLPMDSDISFPQSEDLNTVSRKPAAIVNDTITNLVLNPEQNEEAILLPVQRLASHVSASASSSIQELCPDDHARPAEALPQDMDSAHGISDLVSDLNFISPPHIEMMGCHDVATSNSSNGPLPLAEHEQESLPPGYLKTTQSHHSVEPSEAPTQHKIMTAAVESEPSNHQIPANNIHSSRSQVCLPSEGIPAEHLGSTLIQNSVFCECSLFSIQRAEVSAPNTIEDAVSESVPSFQEIPDNNLHLMRPLENLPLERTHLENLSSPGIQRDVPNESFQNFSSVEWVPPQAISADLLHNELFRVQRQHISCTKKHENKKLLLQSECEQEIENVRRKYDILLQDAEKGHRNEKNMLAEVFQKIVLHKFFAEELRLKFYDHGESSSPSFPAPSQNSSQQLQASLPQPQLASRPSSSSSVPLSIGPLLQPSQTTNQASTSTYLPRLRPQESAPVLLLHSTGLSTHASLPISSDTIRGPINPPQNIHVCPINPRPNVCRIRSPAPHLQRFRSPQALDSSLKMPIRPSLVFTGAPSVAPNFVSAFPAPFPIADSSSYNASGLSHSTPLQINPPQSELPHYAETDDLLESLLANFPTTDFYTESKICSRPNSSSNFMCLSDED